MLQTNIASENHADSFLSPKNNANFRRKQSDLLPAPHLLPASEQPPLASAARKKKKQPIANNYALFPFNAHAASCFFLNPPTQKIDQLRNEHVKWTQ